MFAYNKGRAPKGLITKCRIFLPNAPVNCTLFCSPITTSYFENNGLHIYIESIYLIHDYT
jgi:hypothetical protein